MYKRIVYNLLYAVKTCLIVPLCHTSSSYSLLTEGRFQRGSYTRDNMEIDPGTQNSNREAVETAEPFAVVGGLCQSVRLCYVLSEAIQGT